MSHVRQYELIYITPPETTEEALAELHQQVQAVVDRFSGTIEKTENWGRRKLGLPYWSLSAYLKHKVKNAVQFIADYEKAVANEARRRGVDGVVCGHIHHAEIRTIDGILYCNDGDWVESCTALVEDFDGHLRIVHWAEEFERRRAALPRYSSPQLAAE